MNVGEARRAAATRLAAAGLDEAEIDAEVLLRHALGDLDRAHFFAALARPLPEDVLPAYEALVARRLAREPTAYIVGSREFFGLDFRVTPTALIPRPETELLVEATLQRIASVDYPEVIDVGAGSGAIAVAVAVGHPTVRVLATDISDQALMLTRENAERHDVANRVNVVRTDLLAAIRGHADVVVANPPYVRSADWQRLDPEIRDHEPRLALDGGPDGLVVVRRLLEQAATFIERGAALYVEIGDDEGAEALASARSVLPFARIEVRRDLAGRDRMLTAELRR